MRKNGILMHISSLPSRHGIGTFGQAAYDFADFLASAGAAYWQILPLGPMGWGDSPYHSASAFAGNPYFIDLDILCEEGLLKREEYEGRDWGEQLDRVDYIKLYKNRFEVLSGAFERFAAAPSAEFAQFCEAERWWLDDYALFMAVKNVYKETTWTSWYTPVRMRESSALDDLRSRFAREMDFHRFLQFKFSEQWARLREYVHSLGIKIIGDVPIYVPLDSVDVWAHPENYQLDENRLPREVSGCPPDAYSPGGQKWGNPLYAWDKMREDGYSWWISRLRRAARFFDVVRLDHFRGLESYFAVPVDAPDAAGGEWRRGPGMDFIYAVKGALPYVNFIAEDLGYITPEVEELHRMSAWPGMKVLEFAFDSRESGDYLPYNYEKNCVCYPATHDNAPLLAWERELNAESASYAREYLNIPSGDHINRALIRCGMASTAELFICQMQDWLELGAASRMNTPGAVNGLNWKWRAREDQLTPELAAHIKHLAELYGRM